MRRRTVWLIGLLGTVALWGAAVAYKARPIEQHVALTTVAELKRRGLDRHFEALSIQVDGRDVTLVGTALSEEDRAGAIAAASATRGIRHVADRITVAPLLKPFVFRIARNADGSVTVSGGVPAPDQINRILDLARAGFGRDLRAQLRVARGAPEGDWFAAVRLAIEITGLIEQGEAVLSDSRLAVGGRVANDGALDAVETALARSMPAGYTGRSNLMTRLDEELVGPPIESEAACQTLVDKAVAGPGIRFAAGSAAFENPPPRLFERLALAVRRCPSLFVLIAANSDTYAGDPGANLRLAEARAAAIAAEIEKRGIVRARLLPQGRMRPDPRQGTSPPGVELRVSDSAVPLARPFVWQFEKRAGGNGLFTGSVPSREAQSALADAARPVVRGELADATRLARGAPAGDWLAAARLAVDAMARLDQGTATLTDSELALSGIVRDDEALRAIEALVAERVPNGFKAKTAFSTVLDEALKGDAIAEAPRCQALFDAVTQPGGPELVFDGPALFGHQRRLFERLAAVMRRCPRFAIEIGAHSSGTGDPDAARALSERWAEAVAEALVRAGGERSRLRIAGYGNSRPLADNETEVGRLRNRRVVFRIVP